jgi:transcriptional activator
MTDPLGEPIRYEYYNLAQKYAWAQGGMGPAATEPAAAALHTLSSTFDESANDVRKALQSIGVSWRGQAANATSDALRQAAQATSAAGQSSRSGGNQIEAVGQSWANTKARIPPPIEVGSRNFKDWATDAFDAAFGGVFDMQSDYRKRLHAYQNADATANDALREHEHNVRAANAAFPDFATRPLPPPAPPGPGPDTPQPPTTGGPGAPRPVPPGGPAPNGSPGTPTLPQHNAPAPPAPNPSPAPAPTSPPGSPAPNGGGLLRPDPGHDWIPLVPGTPPPDRRPFPPRRPGPLGPRRDPTGTPRQPSPPRPGPTGPPPGTRPPSPPGTRAPGPGAPHPGEPAPGIPGGSGPDGSGPDGRGPGAPGSGGQAHPPGGSGPGGVAPLPPGAAPGGAVGARPRGSGSRPGRSEGGGWDWGDIGIAVGGPVVGALGVGGAYATIQHNRKHGVGKTLRRSPLQVRVNRAGRHAKEAVEEQGGVDRPGLAYDWAQDVLARDENGQQIHGRYAFNVGGKGEIPQWLNPCTAPGIGFAGPGAHDALRCCVLTILVRTGRRPAGRVIIPTPDATTLLGTAQPDAVPEGLRIVEDYDHALAALHNEITQRRAATREQLEHMPLVVLVLAEPPPTPDQVNDLTDLLHQGHWLGVSALIGDRWTDGATLDIDDNFVVTDTSDPAAVGHLNNAYLFHLPARHLAEAYQDIDNANAAAVYRHGPPPGHPDTPATETSSTETSSTETTATPTGAESAAMTGEPDTADLNGQQPIHSDGDAAAEPDQASKAPTTGTGAHTAPPAPEPAPTGTASAEASPDRAESTMAQALNPPGIHGTAEPEQQPAATTAATTHHTAASAASAAPAGETTTAGQDDTEVGASAVEPSRTVVRLEILHTPRITIIPAGTPDDPDPTPINITPGARSRTRMHVWINMALNRGGRRRAVIAAELFPDANIDRPTNALNTATIRGRQFIQDKTGGMVNDLVHVTEEGLCQLDPEVVEVDYWEFLDAIDQHNAMSTPERAHALQTALKDYRGELAENVDADWITSYRETMRNTVVKIAVDLAYDLSDNHGDHDTAIALLDQAITYDPLAESMYQHVIKLLMNLGRRDAAMQRYDALKTALAAAGMKPLPDTTRLIWP